MAHLLSDLTVLGPAWCTVPAWTDVEVLDLLASCELQGVESVVPKRSGSRYRPGQRSPDWVKMKTYSWRTMPGPLRMARR